ncbi:MAG: hypothetical protein K6F83_02820 [Clostridiales bacterium]|nr:hypothetical protein [Clostridiales bacterium]
MSEAKKKKIVRLVAIIVVAVMLMSLFSGFIIMFIREQQLKKAADSDPIQEAVRELTSGS